MSHSRDFVSAEHSLLPAATPADLSPAPWIQALAPAPAPRQHGPMRVPPATWRFAAGLICCGLAAADGGIGATPVYRCERGDEPPEFTDRPCAGRMAGTVEIDPANVLLIPGLSEREQRQVDALAERQRRRQADIAQARTRLQREARRVAAERRARCNAARGEQDALERQRRKGYSLREAPELDRREQDLQAELRAVC
jgi:hypothetical protein